MNKKSIDPYKDFWKDVKSLDDVLTDGEKNIIGELNEKIKVLNIKTCPHLRLDGKYFYYCGARVSEEKSKGKNSNLEEIGPFNLKYMNHIDICFYQIFCIDDFEKCVDYLNSRDK